MVVFLEDLLRLATFVLLLSSRLIFLIRLLAGAIQDSSAELQVFELLWLEYLTGFSKDLAGVNGFFSSLGHEWTLLSADLFCSSIGFLFDIIDLFCESRFLLRFST
jgi:hypothetical protein